MPCSWLCSIDGHVRPVVAVRWRANPSRRTSVALAAGPDPHGGVCCHIGESDGHPAFHPPR